MKTLLRLVIIGIIFVGCEKKVVEPIKFEVEGEVSYSADIQPYFTSNCITCHGSASGAAGLNLNESGSYESLTTGGRVDMENPAESKIYTYINEGHQGFQDPEIAAYILAWIEQGALDN